MDVRVGSDRRYVADEAGLLALLDELADAQRLVFLLAETDVLGIGVGHSEQSVLVYSSAGSPQPMDTASSADSG